MRRAMPAVDRSHEGRDLADGAAASPSPGPSNRRGYGVPPGAYLTPKTTNRDGGRSYISRSGFPELAACFDFSNALGDDIDALLGAFSKDWEEREHLVACTDAPNNPADASGLQDKGKQKALSIQLDLATCPVSLDITSPFSIFCHTWYRLGWQYVQFTWSEHEPTRAAMYETTLRGFLEWINDVISFVKESAKISDGVARQACGALFALRLLQSSSILTSEDRESAMPGGRIAMAADDLQGLQFLPAIADQGFGTARNVDQLSPRDDVVFVLRQMLGLEANLHGGEATLTSVFDVLTPSKYGLSQPYIRSRLATIAERDRDEHRYGYLEISRYEYGRVIRKHGLSRAMLVYSLMRDRLDLPAYLPEEVDFCRLEEARPLHLADPNNFIKVSGTNGVLGRRGASRMGTGLPPKRDAQDLLTNRTDLAERRQIQYKESLEKTFGSSWCNASPTNPVDRQLADITQSQKPLTAADILQDARKKTKRALQGSLVSPHGAS